MPMTPIELIEAIQEATDSETPATDDSNRRKIVCAKTTIAKGLQKALQDLAEVQRILDLAHDDLGPATLEDIADFAESAGQSCEEIAEAASKAFIL